MKIKNNYNLLFWISCCLAFLVRLRLTTLGYFIWDTRAFKKAMVVLTHYPWKEFYQKVGILEVGYLPLIPIILFLLGNIYIVFFDYSFSFQTPINNTLLYLLKFPPIIFDCLTAGLIYFFFIKDKKKAFLTALLFLFNPVIIYLSSLWGQYGSIYIFFLLLSTYFLEKKKFIKAILIFSISLLVKPQSLVVAPIFFISIFILKKGKFFLKAILYSVIPFIIVLPFSNGNPFIWLFNYFKELNSIETTPVISSVAFNFWSLLTGFKTPVDFLYRGPSLRFWALGIFAIFYFALLFVFLKRIFKRKKIDYFRFFALVFLVFFLFAPQVHERYLLPSVAFLGVIALKNKRNFFYYIFLSVTFLANLAFVLEEYISPSLHFNSFMFFAKPMFELMKNLGTKSALLNIVVFFIFYHDFLLNED